MEVLYRGASPFERKADEDNAMRYRSAMVISYRKGFRRCRVRVESLELMF